MRLALLVLAFLTAACAADPPAVVVPTIAAPSSASPSLAASSPSSPKVPQACPLSAVDLVITTPDGKARTVLSLAPAGDVSASFMGPPSSIAHLDPRGCLVSSDGVEVDITNGESLWTPHERFVFSGSTLRLDNKRAMRIDPAGTIVTVAADGSDEPSTFGGFSFRGYSESSACAARVLLVTFFRMMPSMAVSDGHPRVLPTPDDTACADLHRKK